MSKFCKECGRPILEGEKFCANCGYSFIKPSINEPINKSTYNEEAYNKELKSKKKLNPIIIGAIVAVIVVIALAIGGIGYMKTQNTPEKVINEFNTAIINKDYDNLKDILTVKGNLIEIDETTLQPMVEAYSSMKDELSEVIKGLNEDKLLLSFAPVNNVEKLFTLKSKGKSLLGEKYYIEILPINVTAYFSVEGIEVYKGDELLHTSAAEWEEEEIALMLPGIYNLKANISNEFINTSEEIELTLLDYNSPSLEVLPDLFTLEVDSSIPEAIIHVDGVNTGIAVGDVEEIGPFNYDKEVIIQAIHDDNGTIKKSKEFSSFYSYDIYFDFSSYDKKNEIVSNVLGDIKDPVKAVKETLENYLLDFEYAINYGDFTMIEPYMFYNSSLYTTQKKFVEEQYKQGIKEELVDFEIINVEFTNEYKTTGKAVVKEIFNITNSSKTEESICQWTYTFVYNPEMGIYQLTELQ